MGTVDITIATRCAQCGGRRYIGGFLCGACNGNGAVPLAIRRQDAHKVALRNMAIAVVILLGILGAVIAFTQ